MTAELWREIGLGLWETLYSSVASTALALVLGVPLGIILSLTARGGLKPNPVLHHALGFIVNVLRSIPFLILFVMCMPFTELVTGTTIGTSATIVPLTVAATPFVARLTETSLKEVDAGIIEAAISCGASTGKVVFKAILPEAVPALLANAAVAFVTVVGYSAMAGFCGGGGLGQIAINYGYYRFNTPVMLVSVAVIVVIVQAFQELGLWLAKTRDKRKKAKNK